MIDRHPFTFKICAKEADINIPVRLNLVPIRIEERYVYSFVLTKGFSIGFKRIFKGCFNSFSVCIYRFNSCTFRNNTSISCHFYYHVPNRGIALKRNRCFFSNHSCSFLYFLCCCLIGRCFSICARRILFY